MQVYDINKSKGPFALPIYYAGKQWGEKPDLVKLVKAGLFPYIKPVANQATQKLGKLQIGKTTCTRQSIHP